MEEIGHSLRFPSVEDIIRINRRHIESAGGQCVGSDNLKERGSLEWVLEAIQYPLFGVDPYPTFAEKAAQLAWTIVGGHVFWDGNKRTGMSALLLFVRLNGYRLNITSDEIVEISLLIANASVTHNYSTSEFAQWIRDKLVLDAFS